MKLYGHVNRKSPNSFKLLVMLAEANASCEYIPVDLAGGAQRRPEFLAINSHGKVPVLVDGDFTLPESDAILWYLAETFPEAGLLPSPSDATITARRQRARTLQWCDFASTSVYPAYYDVYLHTASLALEKRNAAIAEAALQRFLRSMAVMESTLLAQSFIAGPYSIADIALASVIQMARIRLPGDPANHPAINAWMARVSARPAWTKTLALVE